jgi:PRTRC genetic system protein E
MGTFTELAALANKGAVLFSIAANNNATITVTISAIGDSELNQDFQVTNTPATFDQWFESGELTKALASYRVERESLEAGVEASKTVMQQNKAQLAQSASKKLNAPKNASVSDNDGESDESDVNADCVTPSAATTAPPAIESDNLFA